MGRFAQAWNFRRQRRGHVFQGRYKAVPVTGERAADAHYFKCVADYIHLNPARAGLAGGPHGSLASYPWSSLRHYAKNDAPDWQPLDRVLDAFQLDHKSRGRRAYLLWLEKRAAADSGKIGDEAMAALRHGWYLGEDGFKDRLLNMLKPAKTKPRSRASHAGEAVKDFGMAEAERIIARISAETGLPGSAEELAVLRKGDPRKVACAALVKSQTAVPNEWLATRLAMGHPASMSKHVHNLRRDPAGRRILKKHEKTLKSKD